VPELQELLRKDIFSQVGNTLHAPYSTVEQVTNSYEYNRMKYPPLLENDPTSNISSTLAALKSPITSAIPPTSRISKLSRRKDYNAWESRTLPTMGSDVPFLYSNERRESSLEISNCGCNIWIIQSRSRHINDWEKSSPPSSGYTPQRPSYGL